MSVCTYDNPATMRRECWANGKLVASYCHTAYFLKKWPFNPETYFFGANIGPWKEGQLVGDAAARVIETTTHFVKCEPDELSYEADLRAVGKALADYHRLEKEG